MNLIFLTVAILLAAIVVFELGRALRTYFKFRGKRIITCPETKKDAAVSLAAGKAAAEAAVGAPKFEIADCTRWPERKDCGQSCLAEIRQGPNTCLVSTIVNGWYAGRTCVYCQKPFGEIHWHDRPPALMDQEHKTVQWNDVPVEKLREIMATHWPVCWNCHIAESFRREHPELVTDRPAH
jgi:hypothetical protein